MNKTILKIIVACMCLLNVISVSAENIDVEYTYIRNDDGKLIFDVAIGNAISVAVGKNGRIFYNNNGIWKNADCSNFENFEQIEYDGNQFIALSKNIAMKSNDGEDWDVLADNIEFSEKGVFIFTNGNYIIEKADGVYTTNDFQNYNKISASKSQSNIFQSSKQDVSVLENILGIADNTDKTFADIKYYFDLIFGGNSILDTNNFDRKLSLFINLSGLNAENFPTDTTSIEFIEMTANLATIYYVKNFELVQATTNDFKGWTETVINLPEQNNYLSSIIIGKMGDMYILAYDTNDVQGIYSIKKYVYSQSLTTFDEVAKSEIRGNVYAENGEIYILTSSELYEIGSGNINLALSEKKELNDKSDIIVTDNGNFMWKRDNGIKLYWDKNGEWCEIDNADNFILSHYIDGVANYQIIWNGNNYIVRPTEYDNGYNPTGAKGNIEIYDEQFNHIKSITLDNYILQMSCINGECYVITDNYSILKSNDFEAWEMAEYNTLPISNGTTEVFKNIEKKDNAYDYIHSVKGIIQENIEKDVMFENWKGTKIGVSSNKYVRYDDCIVSVSNDGIYWKDIVLPSGITKVRNVQFENGKLLVSSSDVDLIYDLSQINFAEQEIYVEIEGKILGFDTAPVIEADRTLVPLRFIFETLDADVDWDNSTETAIVKNNNATIEVTIDNPIAKVNNVAKQMDVPTRLINDKTFVPLRFLSEGLGFNVEWNDATNTVIITD